MTSDVTKRPQLTSLAPAAPKTGGARKTGTAVSGAISGNATAGESALGAVTTTTVGVSTTAGVDIATDSESMTAAVGTPNSEAIPNRKQPVVTSGSRRSATVNTSAGNSDAPTTLDTGGGGKLKYAASTTPITTCAPGKLFLLGEYAVLFGAPAVVVAVDRYVTATIEPAAGHYRVGFAGMALPTISGQWQSGRIQWQQATRGHELLNALCDVLAEAGVLVAATTPFKLHIDSQDLYHDGEKLGLGSSAAVANAVVRAVLEYTGADADSATAQQLVFDAHSRFQHGLGSGADVAAGITGGMLVYERALDERLAVIKKLPPPDDWYMSCVWVGQPASTTSALKTMNRFKASDEEGFARVLAPLTEGAAAGAAALMQSDSAGFLAACKAYCHDLSEFGHIMGLDVMSEAHIECCDIAGKHGVVYKPSGAGDGDFGVALSSDINRLQEFEDDVVGSGFRIEVFRHGRACHTLPTD